MRLASGTKFGKPASFAADSASFRNTCGISGQARFVSGSIAQYRYPVRSVTQPSGPQFDMATDMRNPPGVIILRKGGLSHNKLERDDQFVFYIKRESGKNRSSGAENIFRQRGRSFVIE